MKISMLLAAVLAIVVAGCSSIDVHTDYDPSTDFLSYRSFAVKKDAKIPGDVLAGESFTQERVFAAIEGDLMKKRLVSVAPDKAELIVMVYAGVEDKVNLSTYGYSAGPYWGGYYGGVGGYSTSTQTVVNRYKEGTLHIDILDAQKKTLVWKGSGTGVIEKARLPQEREMLIAEAVAEILADFPPY